MTCAWKELLAILPQWLAREVDRCKHDGLQEVRLRLGQPPQLVCNGNIVQLTQPVCHDDLRFCVNTASRYSPWAAQSSAHGYLAVAGGHRMGLCGEAVIQNGIMSGIRTVHALCIRVARDFPGIAQAYGSRTGSILIIGPPGSGKTTFLRDLIRQISSREAVAVADERSELFPQGYFRRGAAVDILSGCPKTQAIDILLRTMGPQTIAVDEITAAEDCAALQQAGWCGVRLIATAHASSMDDLRSRGLYKPLLSMNLFRHILILNRDKIVREERMTL